jgi:hypothetical protein
MSINLHPAEGTDIHRGLDQPLGDWEARQWGEVRWISNTTKKVYVSIVSKPKVWMDEIFNREVLVERRRWVQWQGLWLG